MSYLEDLSRELSEVGIRGRLRARILTEFSDHLSCDPDAQLGAPDEVARRFADELGSARARRAGFGAFIALAGAGLLFGLALLAAAPQGLRVGRWGGTAPALGLLGLGLCAVGAQVAFVSGLLAALRAFRLRHEPIMPRSEAVLLGRRAGVGIVSGFVALAGLVLVAVAFGHHLPSWWRPLTVGAAGLGMCALAAAAPSVLKAIRLRPTQSGPAGDLFEDLGPLVPGPFRGRPWLFALAVSLGVAALITLAGVVGDDPYDGLLRGLLDAAACLAGFALLGGYLGLRSAAVE